jgi:hypothetical protein
LKTGLTKAAESLEAAQAVSNQLVTLEQRLADGGKTVEVASERAEQLIALNQKLEGNLNLAISNENLDGMIKIQQHLIGESKNVVDAIQTLEVLTGFQDEFTSQIQVLSEMHRNLIEISMMETTLGKVSRMMKPLAELGNLRRMGDDELRNAARLILDGRTATRVSKNSSGSQPQAIRETSGVITEAAKVVPTPDDVE